jgi:hypothetical protein
MVQDSSPFVKFWNRGVDIWVNAASALMVAYIVGFFWFLRKEFELWYDQKKAAYEEARLIGRALFGLKLKSLEVRDSGDASALLHEIETLFLAHFELNNRVGTEFYEKWFPTRKIHKALQFQDGHIIITEVWTEFLSDLAAVRSVPVYPSFPFKRVVRSIYGRRKSIPQNNSK